jgi:broad specificity phosphatase PhoE
MEKEVQTAIFLFRHGQTNRIYVPIRAVDEHRVLSDKGKRQIKKVGVYLADFFPKEIYSSPMKRCRQTSEIIRSQIDGEVRIQFRQELADVYGFNSYRTTGRKNSSLIHEIVKTHPGEQVVVVSHQIPIEHTLKKMGATDKEAQYPCSMGEGYRLVFAGTTLVGVTKLNPAGDAF